VILALLNHLWQSTLFAATAGLLTVTLAKHGAHVRYGLWYAASLKFLLPFSLLVSVGTHIVWTRANAPGAVANILDHVVKPFAAVPAALPAGSMKVALAVAGSTDHLPAITNPPPMLWISLWAAGALVVVMRWLVQWLRIRSAVKCSVLLPMAAPIIVRSSQARVEPGVVGLFRPVLLLPARIAEQLRPDQLQAIVAHELCHVRRRDNLAAAIHMLVEALFWFYPLVWWLGRRLVAEREFACDEAVIAAGNNREAYATGILQVCRHYLESPLICASGVSGADLKSRIERIMASHPASNLSVPSKALLALLAAVAVIAPVAFGAVSSAPLPEGRAQHGEAQELRDLLMQSQFAELDRRMNGYQGGYKSHVLNEDALLRAFAAFDVADPALEPKLNGWVAAFPRSYAAHLARGGYYFVCGTQTRGTRDVAHTTAAQLSGMSLYYGKAQQDLKDSLALDARPLLSYNLLIRIEMESGTQQAARSFLNAALKIDPKAMSVRRAYMRSLQTRWGGSLNEMLAFMQETRKAGFSDDQLWTLEKLIDEERHWLARYQSGKQ
jgi:beta-lactamase regulating signal transducer with metallopeptidase domain